MDAVEHQRNWAAWFCVVTEPIIRKPMPRIVAEYLHPDAMRAAFNAGENAWDYQRKLAPDPPVCSCGRPAPEDRRCYAIPACYECLPPPRMLLRCSDGPALTWKEVRDGALQIHYRWSKFEEVRGRYHVRTRR